MKQAFGLGMVVMLLAACAPMRYAKPALPPQQQASSYATLGEGGKVKHGKPYQVAGQWYYPLASNAYYDEVGVASWYGKKFHGKKTANGETYNMYAMTAAHKTLPMPSLVRVTNLENGKSIQVRVNDRGPFVKGRLIDLSYAAAKALGYVGKGTARVRVQSLNADKHAVSAPPVSTQHTPAPTATHTKALAYVQVGAFRERDNAQSVATHLRAHLQHATPLQVIDAGHVYRVRMGPFQQERQALEALAQVRQQGYDTAMIIHD